MVKKGSLQHTWTVQTIFLEIKIDSVFDVGKSVHHHTIQIN